eukprot:5714444-Prymnesium_polylepis.1
MAREPDRYDDQPVAAMTVYLIMPEYKSIMEAPNPETAFAMYGAARSTTLMNKALTEMRHDDTLTTVGGILDYGLAITYLVPDGVRAWEQVEKAATLDPLKREKRGRLE